MDKQLSVENFIKFDILVSVLSYHQETPLSILILYPWDCYYNVSGSKNGVETVIDRHTGTCSVNWWDTG